VAFPLLLSAQAGNFGKFRYLSGNIGVVKDPRPAHLKRNEKTECLPTNLDERSPGAHPREPVFAFVAHGLGGRIAARRYLLGKRIADLTLG
jgi:hypothetical protein